MKVSRVNHNNENRIKIDFQFNSEDVNKLKQIADVKWSKTLKVWHIPYTKQAFEKLKSLFPEIEIPKEKLKDTTDTETNNTKTLTVSENNKNSITKNIIINVSGRRIAIKLPKNDMDTRFLLTIRFSRWNAKEFCWVVPNYPGNLEVIKDYFKDRILEFAVHEEISINEINDKERKIGKNDLLIIKSKAGRLKLYFGFNKELTKIIKSMPYKTWNASNKYWSIPFAEKYLHELKVIAINQDLRIIYEEEFMDGEKKRRPSPLDIKNYRRCPEEYILKLKELRYSPQTLKVYKALFEEFINYFNQLVIDEIDDAMIISFLRYLVIERKVSTSYQNQAINAIKFYFEVVLKGNRKVYYIDRPKKEKTLPVVLNEKEIGDLLKVVSNIKHKTILMLAYSAGLRLGELINVKIKDIDSKRMQIRIEQGKGKKDRYSILSTRFLDVLRKYYSEYKPKEWLFEGASGGQYSKRSIQIIMQDAVKQQRFIHISQPRVLIR